MSVWHISNWILKPIINSLKKGRSSFCRSGSFAIAFSRGEFCHLSFYSCNSTTFFCILLYNSSRATWHVEMSVPISPACHSSSEVGGASPPLTPTLPTDIHLGKIALISSASKMKAAIKDAVCSLSSHAEIQRSLSLCLLGLWSG